MLLEKEAVKSIERAVTIRLRPVIVKSIKGFLHTFKSYFNFPVELVLINLLSCNYLIIDLYLSFIGPTLGLHL